MVAAEQIRSLIAAELPDLIRIRRDLHAHPELGYQEHRTSQVVQRELEAAGVAFKAGLAGGTGVLGHLPGLDDDRAKAVGLRADMDALPIAEQTGVAHASGSPGLMHACGHDGHTTILIGAARVLAALSRRNALPRPVTFCFQPAEEGGAGAARMIHDGCLNGSALGPPIENMFGLHGWPRLPLGVVATRPGPLLAATDNFEITVRGLGGHAAFPHTIKDPIVAGATIVNALQTIASRNTDPLDAIVVSVTQFHGGTASNIIPQQVVISGTVRSLLPHVRDLAERRMEEISSAIADAFGCEATVEYERGYPVTLNDVGAVEIFNHVARQSIGAQRVQLMNNPVMGGEDFSYYCHEVPSCFFVLGLRPPGRDSMPDLHHPMFDFNDDALATGVELFCRLALRD